nr:MAG TPA: hypothetical protein [Caudoviricetes sp.]
MFCIHKRAELCKFFLDLVQFQAVFRFPVHTTVVQNLCPPVYKIYISTYLLCCHEFSFLPHGFSYVIIIHYPGYVIYDLLVVFRSVVLTVVVVDPDYSSGSVFDFFDNCHLVHLLFYRMKIVFVVFIEFLLLCRTLFLVFSTVRSYSVYTGCWHTRVHMEGGLIMTNEQIAHDLAVARMAGKQLPADVLVDEYKKNYKEILKYLKSQTPKARFREI